MVALSVLIGAGVCPNDAGSEEEWDIPKDPSKFHLFVCLGQSNMAAYSSANPIMLAPLGPIVPAQKEWCVQNTNRTEWLYCATVSPMLPWPASSP